MVPPWLLVGIIKSQVLGQDDVIRAINTSFLTKLGIKELTPKYILYFKWFDENIDIVEILFNFMCYHCTRGIFSTAYRAQIWLATWCMRIHYSLYSILNYFKWNRYIKNNYHEICKDLSDSEWFVLTDTLRVQCLNGNLQPPANCVSWYRSSNTISFIPISYSLHNTFVEILI